MFTVADQFENCREEMIVKPYGASLFHQSFEIESTRLYYATTRNEYGENMVNQQAGTR